MGALFFFLVVLAVAYLVAIRLFSSKARTTRSSASAAMPSAAPELSPRLSHQQDSAADKPRQSDESIEKIQEWVSEAVKHKGEKDYEKALECLDKVYREAAMYEIISNHFSHYIRLPAYLQLAKKNDEGWRQLNLLANGILPHRGPNPTELATDIDWRIEVSDKTRLFLEREKKFEQALWERCTKNMLSTARAMRNHMEASEAVNNEDWKHDKYLDKKTKELFKKDALWSLEYTKKVMQQHAIEVITKDLWKTARKAKFEQERVGDLATEVFTTAMSTKSKLHALAEVADFMVRTRTIIFFEK